MTLRPSETQEGLAWLGNFLPEERHAAELLIDSIRVISSTAFRVYMRELLDGIKLELARPIAFYPIRELPKGLPHPRMSPHQTTEIDQTPDGDHIPLLPLDDPFPPLPGSEGIVANIIRDTIGHRPDLAVASAPESLTKLRKVKPRTIVLVDDYSGTGTRVADYVDSWMQHPTVRSWYSYGLIRFHVAVVTASGSALSRLQDHPRIEGVYYRERAADFSTSMWSHEEHRQILELCEKYAFSPRYKFGYQEAAGLLILQHTVPNNLPAILWQEYLKRRADWKPLFGGRRMTSQMQVDLDDYKLELEASKIAEAMGQVSPRSCPIGATKPNSTHDFSYPSCSCTENSRSRTTQRCSPYELGSCKPDPTRVQEPGTPRRRGKTYGPRTQGTSPGACAGGSNTANSVEREQQSLLSYTAEGSQ